MPAVEKNLEEQMRFIRGLIANPRRVGSVAPSGAGLGRAMAAQIDLSVPGPVLELGPGSGAITRQLLAYGVAPERLIVIEFEPAFAALIAEKFSGINVINGDAFALDRTLAAGGVDDVPLAAVVSSLPMLNFSKERRVALLEAAFDRLAPGAPFIQFTYGFQKPVEAPEGIETSCAAMVWRNIPPAHVWVYRRREMKNEREMAA